MTTETVDRNDLAYWFPKIEAAGLPVPRTTIIHTDIDFWPLVDGEPVEGWQGFIGQLQEAAWDIGYPCFLRTGHISGKHEWRDTCYLKTKDQIPQHVFNLVEQSCIADIRGLPMQTWVVREIIPTVPLFYAFKGMPIAREFRFFVREGMTVHIQPYWPFEAFESEYVLHRLPPDWRDRLRDSHKLFRRDLLDLIPLAQSASRAVPGYWSVDFLQDANGRWWLTDMAEGENSFRWEPSAPEEIVSGREERSGS